MLSFLVFAALVSHFKKLLLPFVSTSKTNQAFQVVHCLLASVSLWLRQEVEMGPEVRDLESYFNVTISFDIL